MQRHLFVLLVAVATVLAGAAPAGATKTWGWTTDYSRCVEPYATCTADSDADLGAQTLTARAELTPELGGPSTGIAEGQGGLAQSVAVPRGTARAEMTVTFVVDEATTSAVAPYWARVFTRTWVTYSGCTNCIPVGKEVASSSYGGSLPSPSSASNTTVTVTAVVQAAPGRTLPTSVQLHALLYTDVVSTQLAQDNELPAVGGGAAAARATVTAVRTTFTPA